MRGGQQIFIIVLRMIDGAYNSIIILVRMHCESIQCIIQ
jgi:hypothetical protein